MTVDSDSELSNRICFVGMNNHDAGRQAGQLIESLLPDGGRVLILAGPLDKANGRDRREGLIDELLGRESRGSDVATAPESVLASERFSVGPTLLDEIDPDAATQQLVAYLNETDETPRAIVGLYGYHATVIANAIEQAGAAPDIRVIGFDAVPETLEAMERGAVHGVARFTTADHQTQSCLGQMVTAGKNEKIAVGDPPVRGVEHSLELGAVKQALFSGEAEGWGIGR